MDAEILTCSFHDFQSYLPFIPSQTLIDSCLESLTTDGDNEDAILVTVGNGRYQSKKFSAKRKSRINAAKHFKVVEETSRRLKKCKIHGRTLTYQYFNCPSTRIHSDIKRSTYKIDGAMVPAYLTAENMKCSGHHTTNIAVACEWKIEPSEANKRKVSGQLPRRAFIVANYWIRITVRLYGQTCKL